MAYSRQNNSLNNIFIHLFFPLIVAKILFFLGIVERVNLPFFECEWTILQCICLMVRMQNIRSTICASHTQYNTHTDGEKERRIPCLWFYIWFYSYLNNQSLYNRLHSGKWAQKAFHKCVFSYRRFIFLVTAIVVSIIPDYYHTF